MPCLGVRIAEWESRRGQYRRERWKYRWRRRRCSRGSTVVMKGRPDPSETPSGRARQAAAQGAEGCSSRKGRSRKPGGWGIAQLGRGVARLNDRPAWLAAPDPACPRRPARRAKGQKPPVLPQGARPRVPGDACIRTEKSLMDREMTDAYCWLLPSTSLLRYVCSYRHRRADCDGKQ